MRKQACLEMALQLLIIFACLSIIAVRWTSTPANAQGTCGGEPRLKAPNNPKSQAWPYGKSYAPIVFDPTTDSEFQQIRDGALDWNSHSVTNCSGVTFQTATRSQAPYDPLTSVPDDTVWVFREDQGSELIAFFQAVAGPQIQEIRAAKVRIQHPYGSSMPGAMRSTVTHELGHGFGLQNETFPASPGRSIMGISTEITACDTEAIRKVYCPLPTPTPTPMPTPAPPQPPGDECNTCNGTGQFFCQMDNRSEQFPSCCSYVEWRACIDREGIWDPLTCTCGSPIVVDVSGDGFDLTGALDGVMFRLENTGVYRQTAWTAAGSDEAWLVLDRNANGTIDSGRELFGDSTPQPQMQPGEVKNGFRALAVFDRLDRGGNNDGFINRDDTVFDDLRLWTDENHNGISEASELRSLRDSGLKRIDLDYRESRRRDAHGNWFRFRSKVRDARDANISRWAWDVFLQQ